MQESQVKGKEQGTSAGEVQPEPVRAKGIPMTDRERLEWEKAWRDIDECLGAT